MWPSWHLTTLWTSTAGYRDNFTYNLLKIVDAGICKGGGQTKNYLLPGALIKERNTININTKKSIAYIE
jgi:hypothetical protein